MIVTKTLPSILSKKDFDCWRSQLNCGTHRDSLVYFTLLGVTTQESPVFRHGECQTYSYAAFGELVASMIGWDLILEYGVASAAVASGWSGYAQGLLAGFNIHLPLALTSAFDASKGTMAGWQQEPSCISSMDEHTACLAKTSLIGNACKWWMHLCHN